MRASKRSAVACNELANEVELYVRRWFRSDHFFTLFYLPDENATQKGSDKASSPSRLVEIL